jgi:hypothetical protein
MHWKRKKKIVEIAMETRKDVIALIKSKGNIYSDVDPKSLECGCGIASTILLKRLHASGYKALIHNSDSHAFIVTYGHILDITATQFKAFEKQKVLLVDRKGFLKSTSEKVLEPWMNSSSSARTSHFIRKQKKSCWPEEQILKEEDLMTL